MSSNTRFIKETTAFEQPYSRHRNNHFSSSSSSFSSNSSYSSRSSNNDEYHSHSHRPETTHKVHQHHHHSNSTTKARVPFSWEYQPGIPKRLPSSALTKPNSDSNNLNGGEYSSCSNSPLLPLPPASSTNSNNNYRRKHHRITGSTTNDANTIDPFLAALVECSKDNITDEDNDHHNSSSGTTTTNHHKRNVNNGALPSIWKGDDGDLKVVKKSYGGITTKSSDHHHMMSRLGMFNYLYQLSCKRDMMIGSGTGGSSSSSRTCEVISDSIVQRPVRSSTSSRRLGTYYHGGRRSTSS